VIIEHILDSILGQHKRQGIGELYYSCPFCHHYNPKFAINVIKRKWQCWHCGVRGSSLVSLLRKLSVPTHVVSDLSKILKDEVAVLHASDTVEIALQLPEEYQPLYTTQSSFEYSYALAYVQSRGITTLDIVRYKLGFCTSGKFKNRIIAPSYNKDGTLNYFVGRAYYNGMLNYLTPSVSKDIVGLENQINWSHPIVIVEGIFDAMAVKRNAIPLFGKHISKKLRRIIIEKNVTRIYLALDGDALKDTITHAEKLMAEGIQVYVVQLSGKDPSNIGFEEMQHLIKSATELSFMDLMKLKLRLS